MSDQVVIMFNRYLIWPWMATAFLQCTVTIMLWIVLASLHACLGQNVRLSVVQRVLQNGSF